MKEKYIYITAGVLVLIAIVTSALIVKEDDVKVADSILDVPVVEEAEEEYLFPTLVYFGNSNRDSSFSCSRVFNIERETKSEPTIEQGLEILLSGPLPEEIDAGFFTSIPENVSLESVSREDSKIVLTFSDELNSAAGSCRVESIRSQIENTVLEVEEFSEIVIRTVSSSPEETLQP